MATVMKKRGKGKQETVEVKEKTKQHTKKQQAS